MYDYEKGDSLDQLIDDDSSIINHKLLDVITKDKGLTPMSRKSFKTTAALDGDLFEALISLSLWNQS